MRPTVRSPPIVTVLAVCVSCVTKRASLRGSARRIATSTKSYLRLSTSRVSVLRRFARRDRLERSGVPRRAPRRAPLREFGHVRWRNEVADRRCEQPREEDRRDHCQADERAEGDNVPREQPERDEEQHNREGLAHVSETLDERPHEHEQRHEPE